MDENILKAAREEFSFAKFRETMHRYIDDAQRLADRNAGGMACHLFAEHDKREFDRVLAGIEAATQPAEAEAPSDAEIEAAWQRVLLWISEIPDRFSPDDVPGGMVVTEEELRCVVDDELVRPLRRNRQPADEQVEKLRAGECIANQSAEAEAPSDAAIEDAIERYRDSRGLTQAGLYRESDAKREAAYDNLLDTIQRCRKSSDFGDLLRWIAEQDFSASTDVAADISNEIMRRNRQPAEAEAPSAPAIEAWRRRTRDTVLRDGAPGLVEAAYALYRDASGTFPNTGTQQIHVEADTWCAFADAVRAERARKPQPDERDKEIAELRDFRYSIGHHARELLAKIKREADGPERFRYLMLNFVERVAGS